MINCFYNLASQSIGQGITHETATQCREGKLIEKYFDMHPDAGALPPPIEWNNLTLLATQDAYRHTVVAVSGLILNQKEILLQKILNTPAKIV